MVFLSFLRWGEVSSSKFDCQRLEENFHAFDVSLVSFLSSSGMRSFSIYTSKTRVLEENTRLFVVNEFVK